MIIVGELINSTRKKVRQAMEEKNADFIQELAKSQDEAGADYIDVNTGAFADRELEVLEWAIKTIREVTQKPLCIDSPRSSAIELGLKLAGSPVFLNSITAEEKKYNEIIPLAKEYNANVVSLANDDSGMPEDVDSVVKVALKLANRMMSDGISADKIFIDPLIRPVSTRPDYGTIVLQSIWKIRKEIPEIKFLCGLSNVSFGLPKRKIINQAFLIMLIAKGVDAAIMDPLDKRMIANIYAAEAILGKDEFCMNYLTADREGKFEEVV